MLVVVPNGDARIYSMVKYFFTVASGIVSQCVTVEKFAAAKGGKRMRFLSVLMRALFFCLPSAVVAHILLTSFSFHHIVRDFGFLLVCLIRHMVTFVILL